MEKEVTEAGWTWSQFQRWSSHTALAFLGDRLMRHLAQRGLNSTVESRDFVFE